MREVKDYPPYLDYPKPRKPVTNADKLRSMSDEELAEFMVNDATRSVGETCPQPYHEKCSGISCYYCWLDWLRQEASDA